MLDFLSSQQSLRSRTDEGFEQEAQSLTALLKCTSCLVHTSESHAVILEIRLSGTSWEH